jgi:hypothetical protein
MAFKCTYQANFIQILPILPLELGGFYVFVHADKPSKRHPPMNKGYPYLHEHYKDVLRT